VKLGLGAHSREFHFGRQAELRDPQRYFEIASQGWELVYITWQMLERPTELAQRIRTVYETGSNSSVWLLPETSYGLRAQMGPGANKGLLKAN
jgi:hypothetical protein